MNADGSSVQKLMDNACTVMDVSADGDCLLGSLLWGQGTGIDQISLREKKLALLIPGVSTQPTRFAPDGKSILYGEFSRGGVTLHRQAWRSGSLIGPDKTELRLPFSFNLEYGGNAFDFARDLSEVVYGRQVGEADIYLLSAVRSLRN